MKEYSAIGWQIFIYCLIFFIFFILQTSIILAKDELRSLDNYQNLFKKPNIFRAPYKEVKHLPSLSKALISEGDIIYMDGSNMMWYMKKPFKMHTVINKHGLTVWIEGQKQPQYEGSRKIIKPMLENIIAIFAGDFKRLQNDFILSIKLSENKYWKLTLTPISSYIKSYLQEINIVGKQYIKSVKIVYSKDKYTTFTFEKPLIGVTHITSEELEIFEK